MISPKNSLYSLETEYNILPHELIFGDNYKFITNHDLVNLSNV